MKKKLGIKKVTLRDLDENQLSGVEGGDTAAKDTCGTGGCNSGCGSCGGSCDSMCYSCNYCSWIIPCVF